MQQMVRYAPMLMPKFGRYSFLKFFEKVFKLTNLIKNKEDISKNLGDGKGSVTENEQSVSCATSK